MLYLAYGSNLNLDQMRVRCPKARPVGIASLPDYRLVFNGVLSIEKAPGEHCPLGVWSITPRCLIALDRYEGFPRFYRRVAVKFPRKTRVALGYEGTETTAWIYIMNRTGVAPPPDSYYQAVKTGYRQFGMNEAAHRHLEAAMSRALYAELLQGDPYDNEP